jgi:hypothetical protein
MNFIQAYMDGFSTCYPHKKIEVKVKRQRNGDPPRYQVVIDSDRGDMTLSEEQMRSATRGFTAGR